MRSRDPSLSKVSSPSRVSFPNTLHLCRDDTDEPWTSRLQYPQPLWCVVLLEQEQQPCTAISGGKVIECGFPLAVALYPAYRFLFLECYQSRGVAAWIVHGCEGSGSVQTLSQCFFDPNFGGWLWSMQLLWRWLWGGWWVQWSGHCFFRKLLPSKASLDSTEQLAGESPTLGHLVGYLPSKDWLILFG